MKAFPTGTGWNHEGDWVAGDDEGMDLRDYFAAKAMAIKSWSHPDHYSQHAESCYKIADAMMKAREK